MDSDTVMAASFDDCSDPLSWSASFTGDKIDAKEDNLFVVSKASPGTYTRAGIDNKNPETSPSDPISEDDIAVSKTDEIASASFSNLNKNGYGEKIKDGEKNNGFPSHLNQSEGISLSPLEGSSKSRDLFVASHKKTMEPSNLCGNDEKDIESITKDKMQPSHHPEWHMTKSKSSCLARQTLLEVQQMKREISHLRREMNANASLIKINPCKPFTPTIQSSLKPYYNTRDIDRVDKELGSEFVSWSSYGQRNTAFGIVDPHVSWRMDNVHLFTVSKRNGSQSTRNLRRLNLPESDHKDKAGTKLPKIALSIKRIENPDYQHFNMTYDQVPAFRREIASILSEVYEKRQDVGMRARQEWKRLQLHELEALPATSFCRVEKAIDTYLSSSLASTTTPHELRGRPLPTA